MLFYKSLGVFLVASLGFLGPLAASELAALVDRYPSEVKLWDSEPLRSRLRALLGKRVALLRENMGVEGPIQRSASIYYVIGNRPHFGGEEAAIVAIDETADAVHVWLMSDGELNYYADGQSTGAMPPEIELMLSDWER